jgi:hypothetical protein
MNLHDIKEYIELSNGTISLFRTALRLMPKSAEKRHEIEEKIDAAEALLKRSDATLAKTLGMRLCDCKFPPEIMLWREKEQAHVCPNPECGRRHIKPKVGTQKGRTSLFNRRI